MGFQSWVNSWVVPIKVLSNSQIQRKWHFTTVRTLYCKALNLENDNRDAVVTACRRGLSEPKGLDITRCFVHVKTHLRATKRKKMTLLIARVTD